VFKHGGFKHCGERAGATKWSGGSRVGAPRVDHDGSPEKFDGRFSVTEPEEREETKFFVGFQR
jgi:hypothetical protein